MSNRGVGRTKNTQRISEFGVSILGMDSWEYLCSHRKSSYELTVFKHCFVKVIKDESNPTYIEIAKAMGLSDASASARMYKWAEERIELNWEDYIYAYKKIRHAFILFEAHRAAEIKIAISNSL